MNRENDDFQIYFAGICETENGPMWYGFSVVNAETGKVVYQGQSVDPDREGNTDHLANYMALAAALEWAYKKGYHRKSFIRFFGHSELVCKQMSGEWNVGEWSYKSTAVRCLVAQDEVFWHLTFELIPEEKNIALSIGREVVA